MSWESIKLSFVCHKITDGSHNPPQPVDKNNYPMLSSKNIVDNRVNFENPRYIPSDSFHQENKRTDVSTNDVLLTIVGTIGRVAIVLEEYPKFVLQRSVAVLKPNVELIHPRFLMYTLQNSTHSLLSDSRGVAQKGIYLNKLRELKILLPPLHIQKNIVDILDSSDNLKRIDVQLIDKYEKLSRSLFLNMFGESVINSTMWGITKLKNLSCRIKSGSTPKGGSKVYVEDGITFLRSQNVLRNKIELEDVVYIDNSTHISMDKSSLKKNDILITKTGRINTENSSLGRAALFTGDDDSANINGHIYLVRLREEANHEFILFILTSDEYKHYIRSISVGGIDKRQLNKSHIENFPMITPPLELQDEFVKRLRLIEAQKELAIKNLNQSSNLFSSLLQRAFKGELTQAESAS